MTLSLIHLSDPHLGEGADLEQLEAIERLVPDLEPDLVVVSGDVTVRARHGEFVAAKAFVRELERSAPVYVLPGSRDVQWWTRPLVPFGGQSKYRKFQRYFGPVLTPTLDLTEGLVTGALTAHGVAWGSLTTRFRDLGRVGHLPQREIRRIQETFAKARPEQARVLVVHHNVLPAPHAERPGLVRAEHALRRMVAAGADLILCGHGHAGYADVADGVIVSCAGTVSSSHPTDHPPSFHRICVEDDAVQLESYRWEADRRVFRRTDFTAFARPNRPLEASVAAGAV